MKKSIFVALALFAAANLSAMQIWPILLDGTSSETVQSYITADLQPNEVDRFLYIWDGTYIANAASGQNFYGNGEGYLSMIVGNSGWAGAGYCLTADGNGWQAAADLKDSIVANPENYFLHIAMKATDNFSHCFNIFGAESTKFVIGKSSVYDGPVYDDFERDGEWHEFYIPMSRFANALANQAVAAGVNVFAVLSEGIAGAQLNMDAVYFCDAEFKENNPLSAAETSDKKSLAIKYLDNAGAELDDETLVFHFPVAPAVEGFTFIGWQTVADMIVDAIEIQAVYQADASGAPAVVVNPANAAQKLVRQGNVYILTDEKTYSVSGKRVK